MGGHGHGPHIVGNERNFKESDEEMRQKIQRVDLIKFNPNHFHLDFWSVKNMYEILGGAPTLVLGAVGATVAFAYYSRAATSRNFYTNNMRAMARIALGWTFGVAVGYNSFGDRQRLHNAYVAERLRRRYPESMELHQTDLWKLKGVQPPHEFYKWQ